MEISRVKIRSNVTPKDDLSLYNRNSCLFFDKQTADANHVIELVTH